MGTFVRFFFPLVFVTIVYHSPIILPFILLLKKFTVVKLFSPPPSPLLTFSNPLTIYFISFFIHLVRFFPPRLVSVRAVYVTFSKNHLSRFPPYFVSAQRHMLPFTSPCSYRAESFV